MQPRSAPSFINVTKVAPAWRSHGASKLGVLPKRFGSIAARAMAMSVLPASSSATSVPRS